MVTVPQWVCNDRHRSFLTSVFVPLVQGTRKVSQVPIFPRFLTAKQFVRGDVWHSHVRRRLLNIVLQVSSDPSDTAQHTAEEMPDCTADVPEIQENIRVRANCKSLNLLCDVQLGYLNLLEKLRKDVYSIVSATVTTFYSGDPLPDPLFRAGSQFHFSWLTATPLCENTILKKAVQELNLTSELIFNMLYPSERMEFIILPSVPASTTWYDEICSISWTSFQVCWS